MSLRDVRRGSTRGWRSATDRGKSFKPYAAFSVSQTRLRGLDGDCAGDDTVAVGAGYEHGLRIDDIRHEVKRRRWGCVQFKRQRVTRSGAGGAIATDGEAVAGDDDACEQTLI